MPQTQVEKDAIMAGMNEARDEALKELTALLHNPERTDTDPTAIELINWFQKWSPKAGYKRLGRLLQNLK